MAASQTNGLSTPSYACPTTTYSASYNFGYTWYNYTDTYGFCDVSSEFDIYGFAYLYDMTSGSYFYPSNYWSGMFNYSYTENYSYNYAVNYSNSSYWAYNYSYSYAFNGTGGTPGTFVGTVAPQWFVNGTFSSTDSYQVITYVGASQYSSVEGFAGSGHASTSINMAGTTHHENLLPFSIW